MLGDEFGTASNIKSRVNRQSVLGAITSAQQRLKLYNKASLASVLAVACAGAAPTAEQGATSSAQAPVVCAT
jgi:peptide subunit release factor 1 (eRF1)